MLSPHQVIGRKQSEQSKNVVPVQVTDKDVVDLRQVDGKPAQLYLGPFATIN
jgi:hypothetical protein